MGEGTWTGRNVEIQVLRGLTIILGNYVSLQDGCKVIGNVIIESYCLLAPNVFISSGRHYAAREDVRCIRAQDYSILGDERSSLNHSKRIHVEEDCWIGYSAFIRAGVYVGRGAIIGANAVVTKPVQPYEIVAGANVNVGRRLSFDPPDAIASRECGHWPYFYRGFVHPIRKVDHSIEDFKFQVAVKDGCIVVLRRCEIGSVIIVGKVESTVMSILEINLFSKFGLCKVRCELSGTGDFIAEFDVDRKTDSQPQVQDEMAFSLLDSFNVYKLSFEMHDQPEGLIYIGTISQRA